MPGWFSLQLDTHAPVVTWGPVDGAVAGEELIVQYLVNEPGVYDATVTLGDGRVLPMAIGAGDLRVVLPDDTPNGHAQVRAYTRDDVDNAGQYTLVVAVSGVVTEPEVPVPPGGVPVSAPTTVRFEPSRATASSRDQVSAVVTTTSRGDTWSYYRAPDQRTRFMVERIAAASADRLNASVSASASATTGSRDTIWRRPEGPDIEAAIIALDLL